jgi:hypothetical protein
LYENIQVIEDKTIGEIDFIIEDKNTKQVIHMELAYKFYLFDPSISSEPINNWIGPNRNDSLQEKLEKLKTKQFPLLYHKLAKSKFTVAIDQVSQAMFISFHLFPMNTRQTLALFKKAIKGYYVSREIFISLDHPSKTYYIPSKKEWEWTQLKMKYGPTLMVLKTG